ncbi:MAG: hypothetical protein Q9225_005380 [Loekoesia sp. 1 TL-2023]
MPTSIPSPILTIRPTPLTQSTFAPFGTVIESPLSSSTFSIPSHPPKSSNVVPANQNTALKYLDVTQMRNLYDSAPSKVPSKAVMNMFSCFPRSLRSPTAQSATRFFDVKILERHRYTTQTFIPLSPPSVGTSTQSHYLVIVAPTIPPTSEPPFNSMGLPDLNNVQSYWAHRGQAVTYGAGTWHAPMAVIGDERIDFVVVQFANGVMEEDCQEVELEVCGPSEGVSVNIGHRGRDEKARI